MRAGFGRAVITPPLPVALAGFSGRAGPATEVRDDLEARVILFDDGATKVCLVVCDLLGMTAEFADPIRHVIAGELDMPVAAVLTSCIHTHAGPNCMKGGEQLGWPTPDGYLDILVRGCVGAARQAAVNLEAAELHYVRAPLPAGVSINRRGNPYDPTFAALDVRSPAGDRLGTIANVSIHPVAMGRNSLAVSSDWVGTFRNELEATAGGRTVLLSGALGDVNPRPHVHEHEEGSFEHADAVGHDVAAAVSSVLPAATPLGGALEVVAQRHIEAPVAGLLAALGGYGESMPVEFVEWSLGGARLVSVPGEAFHALGREIESSRGEPVLLAGLAPVWQGYLPVPFGDGYEEGVSFGAAAVDAIRAALVEDPAR